ncbi:MAG: type II toxin-antitoxin system Phd/YefM family antitoxin [Erysipelotrichaceae bacterium]|nr:type II toxin-antitoxin system Phd/YefM family antitoxin [Erysipelotrichaceae bacterium]
MANINITNFRKNVYSIIENTIRFNEPVHITTKEGNAVIISEEEYNSLVETLNLVSLPGMREKLIEGLNTPIEETVNEDEVDW